MNRSNPDSPWTPSDIVLALRVRGYSLARIARELDLTYARVRYAVSHGTCPEVRRLCSRELQVLETDLWPSRFPPQWREGSQGP